ncbi:MAG: outer membrane protein assembly factor BamA, partial [Paracoccaceae bacterium]
GAAQAQTYQFSSFQVAGNDRVETSTILTYAGISPGVSISAAKLNEAYQQVLATGLFETVEFVPRGGTLLIRVVEYPTINRVNVEGNLRISDEDALALFQSQPRLVFSPSQVEQDAAALTQAYRAQGRFSATVTPRIIERSNNRVDVVFEVTEGRTVEVERLSFVGNRAYSDRRLRRVLETKQAGVLRALIRQDTFVEDRIEFDRVLLRDFYQARGYVDFQILSVSSEFSRERNAFFVIFSVREGQRFTFAEITTVSEMAGVDADDYQGLSRIRPGQVYSPAAVDNTIARIERKALQDGFNLLRVEPRVTRNDRDLSLNIEFALVQGARVFVERIEIKGNTTTFYPVVRRQFRLVEGDPFNPREIREAAARIRALPMFSSSQINARQGSATDQVVVDVDVVERLTGSLSFGAAYNFATGVGLTAGYREQNFLGRGQTLIFDVNLSQDSAGGGISFTEPGFLDRDLAFQFDGEYRQTEFEHTDYDTQTLLFRPAINFPISENGRMGLRYTLSNDKIFNVDVDSSPILMAEAAGGAVLASAVGYSFTFDTRRTGINPNAGVVFRVGQDFAGLGGSAKYVRSTAILSGEMKVLNEEVTLRATLEGGALLSFSGDSRLTERFFLTSNLLRGFAPAGVGPRDLDALNLDALGGNYFAVVRLETDFPIGLPEEIGIGGGLFLDVGSVWGLDNTSGAGLGPVDDSFRLRSAAGFTIFWTTPIGPLRFNFSRVLIKESYDQVQNFDLTISTQF